VVRTPSIDPTRLFGRRKRVALPSERVRGAVSRLSQFVLVPDNKIGWKKLADRAVARAHGDGPFDVIFSSAPPYTAHLVGATAKARYGAPLLVDFRDDWLDNPRHTYATPVHRMLHRRMERRVLAVCDGVICVNHHIREAILARHRDELEPEKVVVLPHGFDPGDFSRPSPHVRGTHCTLLYTGTFYDAQKPDPLLKAVAKVVDDDPAARDVIRLEFAGTLPASARALASRLGIERIVRYHGYLPHEDVVRRLREADVLWMIVGRRPGAEGITTGKLFEYFGSGRPILGLVPEGEARSALRAYGAAVVVDPDDLEGIAEGVRELLQKWRRDSLPTANAAFIQQFDRERLTGQLARIMTRLVEEDEPVEHK